MYNLSSQYRGTLVSPQQVWGSVAQQVLDGIRQARSDLQARSDRQRLEERWQQQQARADEERLYQRSREATADARAAQEASVREALQAAELRERGILRGAMPEAPRVDVPIPVGAGMSATMVTPMQDVTRYSDLGGGFYLDRDATPAARDAKRQQLIARITARALAGEEAALGEAVGAGMSVADALRLDPRQRPGTPQALAVRRAEGEVDDVFDARQHGRQVAGQLRLARENNAVERELAEVRAYAHGRGTPAGSTPTETERKTAGLLEIAQSALSTLDAAPTPNRLQAGAARLGLNEALNDRQQKVVQAGMMMADAYLRFTSGANAPEAEVTRVARMLTPMPGDTEATRQVKADARETVLRAMTIGAGRAAAQVTPRPVAADSSASVPLTNDDDALLDSLKLRRRARR